MKSMRILPFILGILAAAAARAEKAPTSPLFTSVAALIDGAVYAQKGRVHYTRPQAGDTIKVNDFGQYQEIAPLPVFVKFETGSQRPLQPNSAVSPGEVVLTGGEGFAKLLFRDESLVDIGPSAAVEIARFDVDADLRRKRDVELKIAYGKFRVIVAESLKEGQSFKVFTPNAMMTVRGTEFIVNVFTDQDGLSQTDVVCAHGQVSLDVAKPTTKGLVYHHTVVLNPSNRFTTSGHNGLAREAQLATLTQDQLRGAIKATSPQVNVFATYAASAPKLMEMPGTGASAIARAKRYPEFKALEGKPLVEDLLQPSRRIAGAYKNFAPLQKDFEVSPIAPGLQRHERISRHAGTGFLE